MENYIYPILIEREMTQAQLAELVGVKREYLNRIISGKITPRMPLGLRIARALELPVESCFSLMN
ncbi:MAG: helix-turn-helix transcriptional regulator [bacterium]